MTELSEDTIVYPKDRPIKRLFMICALVVVVVSISVLSLMGFIIGITGNRPPTVDSGIVKDKWEQVTKDAK